MPACEKRSLAVLLAAGVLVALAGTATVRALEVARARFFEGDEPLRNVVP